MKMMEYDARSRARIHTSGRWAERDEIFPCRDTDQGAAARVGVLDGGLAVVCSTLGWSVCLDLCARGKGTAHGVL